MPPIIVNSGPVLNQVECLLTEASAKKSIQLFNGFVDQAVVERLRHVVLLGFGMVDEL
jgi:hypothetical protein